MFKNYSEVETPQTKKNWHDLSEVSRVNLVESTLRKQTEFHMVIPLSAHSNGEVYVELRTAVSSNMRGTLLLNCEELLKREIDEGITIWLEPLGDKSTLRNLRGIKIKTRRQS
jgi:hypothetical protein